jgi:hypothetical protein
MADLLQQIQSGILGTTGTQATPSYANSLGQSGSVMSPTDFIKQTFGDYLSPTGQFTQELPYDTFAKPFQDYAGGFFDQYVRPEYKKQVQLPWQRQTEANLASTGGWRSGGMQRGLGLQKEQMAQNLAEQRAQIIDSMLRPLLEQEYAKQFERFAMSPLSFQNL